MKRVWELAPLVMAAIVASTTPAFAQPAPNTFTKSFGASSIPLNGTTTLTFTVGYVDGGVPSDSFTDTLPAGLVVATPNGFTGVTGTGSCETGRVTVTATPGSSSVSADNISFCPTSESGSCSFSVNVTGTTVGIQNNSVTDALDVTATASLDVIAPPGVELENYFSNASTTGGQAYVNIIAPLEGDTTGPSAAVREGETCAMIYVFNTEQSLQACCGCPVTADGLLTLNITTQLAGNPVALGKLLQDGVIRIISTLPNAVPPPATVPPSTPAEYIGCDSNTQVCCDPTAVPADTDSDSTVTSNQLVAWGDHIQNTQITETEFDSASALEIGAEPEEDYDPYGLPEACGAIVRLGSLQGTCTCPTGPVGFTPTAKPRR
jgi:hypothetical protein